MQNLNNILLFESQKFGKGNWNVIIAEKLESKKMADHVVWNNERGASSSAMYITYSRDIFHS